MKDKKKFSKVLNLKKETISQLADSEMTHANGGGWPTNNTIEACSPGPTCDTDFPCNQLSYEVFCPCETC